MNGLRRMVAVTVVAAGMFSAAVSGFSYALNPWTGMTGEKVLAINPFVYVTPLSPLGIAADLIASYGVTPNIDVFVDVASFSAIPGFGYSGSWIMPRYDFGGSVIGALKLGYVGSAPLVSPQFHYFMENDTFAFEFNAYVDLTIGSTLAYNAGAYIAPVWKVVKDLLYVYVDIDPAFNGAFTLGISPGVCLNLGAAGQISVGVNLGNALSFGGVSGITAWYWVPIKL